MSNQASGEYDQMTDDNALKEYELAVRTQMHFNEILMRFRAFGIAVVIAVYSYAITRKDLGISFAGGLSPTQVLAYAGMTLTIVLAIAEKTGLNRESLYRMLSRRGNPEIKSLSALLNAMGLRLAVEAGPHSSEAA